MAYVCSCSQYLMAQAAPLGPEPWRRHWSAAAACLRQAGKQRFPWAQSVALRTGCGDSLHVLSTF